MKKQNKLVLFRTAIVIMLIAAVCSKVTAKENTGMKKKSAAMKSIAAGCSPSTAKTELSINNIRTTILINGDMWWDAMAQLGPQYEIPKGGGIHAMFTGALWIGGIDASGQLKVSAQTYRQDGSDFWPGPLDTTSASVDPSTCLKYDRHWNVTLQEIQDYIADNQSPSTSYVIPEAIASWPGNGDPSRNQTRYLAPYVDVDLNGEYNVDGGDYPNHSQLYSTPLCQDVIFGDQCIWWVFNDVGNIHTETGGAAIGMEVQAQAFAFTTNDELNNMTFYRYKIINRSSAQIDSTYFGQWADPDLGQYLDDYVGCDVAKGLGYCYNGDQDDEGPRGYGLTPPSIGIDFFEGPKADLNDSIDNNRDGQIDETGEQIIMAKFVYYNNDFSITGNPQSAQHYYNYLTGFWTDGTPITYGGNGYGGSTQCDFMFPGTSDLYGWGVGGTPSNPNTQSEWSEATSGNTPFDRRFLQSSGQFTLKPGALNYITTGVVWARASQGGPLGSVKLLQTIDKKAQTLFDNCFDIIDGPDAPDLSIRELDKEIILSISNAGNSNNYLERYKERDPSIPVPKPDSMYTFQGYQIYQIKDETVTASDLKNLDKARLVAQADIKDETGGEPIINYYLDNDLGAWVPREEAFSDNKGIRHTFRIMSDEFALGDKRLINHKNYFYMVIAYGYNVGERPVDPYADTTGINQPYLAGRKNVKVYTAIPHISSPENYGQDLNAMYGIGPRITRIEGQGSGYIIGYSNPDANATNPSEVRLTLDLTPETVNEILSSATGYRSNHPVYESGRGPVDLKVYDATKVQKGQYELWFDSTGSNSHWYLMNMTTGEWHMSDTTLSSLNEQVFPQWGISAAIKQLNEFIISDTNDVGHGFVEGTITFADPTRKWLTGVSDNDGVHNLDWIISSAENNGIDKGQVYENVLGGTWAPYRLCNTFSHAPAVASTGAAPSTNFYKSLPSIDVVITSDKSKWSKCVVLEEDSVLGLVGNVPKLYMRKHVSLDIDGNPIPGDSGRSYFPGYAINLESGERLNIMFGEDSWLVSENGNDMKWNPTSGYFTTLGTPLLGGKHFIYVVNSNSENNPNKITPTPGFSPYNIMNGYDGCDTIQKLLQNGSTINRSRVFKNICWVGFPLLTEGQQFMSNDVKIRLRVAQDYEIFGTGIPVASGNLVPGQNYVLQTGKIKHNGIDYIATTNFTAVDPNYTLVAPCTYATVLTSVNKGYPKYAFSLDALVNDNNNVEAAKTALDLINVVPNPYYAYSSYEGSLVGGVAVQPQLDNRIKIVNLPPKCVISIFTVNGILVKKFSRDVAADNSAGAPITSKNFETSQDWDLKNHKGVPIASGLYLIHVEAPGIGERTLKWFGAMRPIDLDAF